MVTENTSQMPTDDELAGQIHHSPNAFWELFERHHGLVYRYFAVSSGASPAQVLEMTARSFWIMLWQHRTFQQIGFVPWFFGITWDVINEHYLQSGADMHNLGHSPGASVHHQRSGLSQKDIHHNIRTLRKIPFYQRETLYLRFFASLDTRDIGILMDRSESGVKVLICQGVYHFCQQWESAAAITKISKEQLAALSESYHAYLLDVLAGLTSRHSISIELIRATSQMNALREALSFQPEMRPILVNRLKNMLISHPGGSGRL